MSFNPSDPHFNTCIEPGCAKPTINHKVPYCIQHRSDKLQSALVNYQLNSKAMQNKRLDYFENLERLSENESIKKLKNMDYRTLEIAYYKIQLTCVEQIFIGFVRYLLNKKSQEENYDKD